MRKILAIITIAIMMLSTLPAVIPHGVLVDQTDKTAALVGDVFASSFEEVYVQYLGNVEARLHFIYYNGSCIEDTNYVKVVTPYEIVKIDAEDGDRKLVVLVENANGTNLLNQPLAGTIYYSSNSSTRDRRAVKNIPALTAVTNTEGAIISPIVLPSGYFLADGVHYNVFPQNFISLLFLTNTSIVNMTMINNSIAVNDFNGTTILNMNTYNDDEKEGSKTFPTSCAGLISLSTPGFYYNAGIGAIAGVGITEKIPYTDAGAGAIRSLMSTGKLLVESTFNLGTPNGAPEAISNVFMYGNGDSTNLSFIPAGIFTGKNENYQNPELGSALASIGIQKAIEDDPGTQVDESKFNIETVFAIFNNATTDKTLSVRFDYIQEEAEIFNECTHNDLEVTLTREDIAYFRVSQFTNAHLEPGDAPIYGVLTVWDPQSQEALAGFRWDNIMESVPISERVENDEINKTITQEAMLSLSSTVENGVAVFEAAEHATTYVPTVNLANDEDFNLIYVNWDALDDPTALDQVLAFQVTDDDENVKSIKIPITECITVLNKQSFAGLSDGELFASGAQAISYTGRIDQPNKGIAAFLYYNSQGLPPTENYTKAQTLALTNQHHDGEIFTDIQIQPGSMPGPGGTFNVQVGITPSVTLINEIVTAGWYAANGTNPKVRGPLNCEQAVTISTTAGKAFAIVVSGCLVDPLSIDSFLRVHSTNLGDVELFVPATN